MSTINFRNRYELDPASDAGDGGLPGMLQLALLQQSLLRQRTGPGSLPQGVSEHDPNSFAGLQGGRRGTSLAMQPERALYQPGLDDHRSASFVPLDSNFRQLSRTPADGSSSSRSDRSNESANPVIGAFRNSFSLSEGASPAGDTFDTIAARRNAPSAVPVGWRTRGGITIRTTPPPESLSAPPTPMPTLPDWWVTAAKIGRILTRGMYGSAGDGRGAYGRCVRASEGSVDDWEDFCKFLDRGENNTVGGESQNRACWGKTFQSENEKKGWCQNQFGNR